MHGNLGMALTWGYKAGMVREIRSVTEALASLVLLPGMPIAVMSFEHITAVGGAAKRISGGSARIPPSIE